MKRVLSVVFVVALIIGALTASGFATAHEDCTTNYDFSNNYVDAVYLSSLISNYRHRNYSSATSYARAWTKGYAMGNDMSHECVVSILSDNNERHYNRSYTLNNSLMNSGEAHGVVNRDIKMTQHWISRVTYDEQEEVYYYWYRNY